MPDLWGAFNGEDDSPIVRIDPLRDWQHGSGSFFNPIRGETYEVKYNYSIQSTYSCDTSFASKCVCVLLEKLVEENKRPEDYNTPSYFNKTQELLSKAIRYAIEKSNNHLVIGFHFGLHNPTHGIKLEITSSTEEGETNVKLVSFEKGNYIADCLIVYKTYDQEAELILSRYDEETASNRHNLRELNSTYESKKIFSKNKEDNTEFFLRKDFNKYHLPDMTGLYTDNFFIDSKKDKDKDSDYKIWRDIDDKDSSIEFIYIKKEKTTLIVREFGHKALVLHKNVVSLWDTMYVKTSITALIKCVCIDAVYYTCATNSIVHEYVPTPTSETKKITPKKGESSHHEEQPKYEKKPATVSGIDSPFAVLATLKKGRKEDK